VKAPPRIDYETLSTRSLWTVKNIALPLATGLSYSDIAARYGKSSQWAASRMKALRCEIARRAADG
jgi:hypothetical protein